MLKSTFGLELKKGVVTENEITNLIQPIAGQSNIVKIDGVEYFDPNGKLYNMIGRYVLKNGVAYGGYSESSLNIPAGKAELIDNNADGARAIS